jgi:hypothetical protein
VTELPSLEEFEKLASDQADLFQPPTPGAGEAPVADARNPEEDVVAELQAESSGAPAAPEVES